MKLTDDKIDKLDEVYQAEYARWGWAYRLAGGFMLVRYISQVDIITGEPKHESILLTRRECRDKHEAESWLRTYRGRAAMRAVLEAI